ncbi:MULTISPECIES: hypothetical protein [unclassified Desulfovibrio]|nr:MULTISPECIES: hypothetical protein [unclassified Desulfovibrio]
MDSFKRRGGAPRRAGRPAAAWRAFAALLTLLLLGGCSRLLSIVDPSAF